jgi:hypothetical protein
MRCTWWFIALFLPQYSNAQFLFNLTADPNERYNLYGLEEYSSLQVLLDERMAYYQQFEREPLGQASYAATTWSKVGAAVPWLDYDTPPPFNNVQRAEPDEDAPHIVFIMVDDVGWSDIGYSEGNVGWAPFATPRIDELASKGVKLNSHYTSWVIYNLHVLAVFVFVSLVKHVSL